MKLKQTGLPQRNINYTENLKYITQFFYFEKYFEIEPD